jgi:hypothetical protein
MDKITIEVTDLSKVSDGYHTIAEVYEHRIRLWIAPCKEIAKRGGESSAENVWRSKVHSDGSSYEGWFLLAIGSGKGEQKSYHIPLSYWDETEFAFTYEKAPEFDGHTSSDVLERLKFL